MLHLNLPAASDSERTVAFRKLRWLLLGLLAPELLVMFALAQFKFVQHCTFPSYEPFAITANQVAYLTEHGYIDMPTITRREIRDQAGEAAGQGFTDTPLDFIEQNIY
ncbi:hypothetical protein F4824DRAFT_503631 [Ustulina deusta]|nr:hypothetical protein F4824DRAFT_503631 [Ustulina deusta]